MSRLPNPATLLSRTCLHFQRRYSASGRFSSRPVCQHKREHNQHLNIGKRSPRHYIFGHGMRLFEGIEIPKHLTFPMSDDFEMKRSYWSTIAKNKVVLVINPINEKPPDGLSTIGWFFICLE